MANQVKGVIAGAKGEAVSVETVVVPDPGLGEGPDQGAGLWSLPH